jgi:hypothetical protein
MERNKRFFCPFDSQYRNKESYKQYRLFEQILREAFKLPEMSYIKDFIEEAIAISQGRTDVKELTKDLIEIADHYNLDLSIDLFSPKIVVGGQMAFGNDKITLEVGQGFMYMIQNRKDPNLNLLIDEIIHTVTHERIHGLEAPNEKAALVHNDRYVEFDDSKPLDENTGYFYQIDEVDAYAIQFATVFSKNSTLSEVMSAIANDCTDICNKAHLSTTMRQILDVYRKSPQGVRLRFFRRLFEYYNDRGLLNEK